MNELDSLIEQIRIAYTSADRAAPGPFVFVTSVTTANGGCICAVALAVDCADARQAAAKVLIG